MCSKHVFHGTLGSHKLSVKLLSQVYSCLSPMWLADLHGGLIQKAWFKKKLPSLCFSLQAVAEISSFLAFSLFLFAVLDLPLSLLLNFAINETKNSREDQNILWYNLTIFWQHLMAHGGMLKEFF